MKASTLLGVAVILAAACSAQATIVVGSDLSTGAFTGGSIPDGNPAGFVTSLSVSGVTDVGAVDNVTVALDISGGYNGDLYGYLVYQPASGSAITEVLLNRPGLGNTGGGPALQYFGYATAGMNVTLNDTTVLTSIDQYGGNTPNPGIPTGTYNSSGGGLNSAFNGISTVNGTWTLALFDMSAGGGTAVLNGATLNVDEVPEPVTWALIIFAAMAVPVVFLKRRRQIATAAEGNQR